MLKFFPDKYDIIALMSEKLDGSMRVFESGINNESRRSFFEKNSINKDEVISAEIIHSSCAKVVDRNSPRIVKGVDALVTNDKNIFLAVTVADCIPIYFYDKEKKMMGIAHAGWRGIIGGIAKNVLIEMNKLGSNNKDIEIVLGPGLQKCHFEIQNDILDKFKDKKDFIFKENNKIFVDLFGIIKKELIDRGVLEKNIFDIGECTYCNKNRFFSYRRDDPQVVEAMMAIIGISF